MSSYTSTYEERRRANLAENRRVLLQLGLIRPINREQRVVCKVAKRRPSIKRKRETSPPPTTNGDSQDLGNVTVNKRRRSCRLQNLPADSTPLKIQDEEVVKAPPPKVERPNSYGNIEGIEVGRTWETRLECNRDGIHRPTVAGIHGGPEGAYSLALSGGYEDDIDLGLSFTYTGEGGRDLKGTKANPKNLRTAPQSKDQTLTRGNLALSKSCDTGNPVRVIRGYKLPSPFAPDAYRYDGLYTVEKAWYTEGLSGLMVWKFALKRLADQAPPPWEIIGTESEGDTCEAPTELNRDNDEKSEKTDGNNNELH